MGVHEAAAASALRIAEGELRMIETDAGEYKQVWRLVREAIGYIREFVEAEERNE